jgi:hypothetical protein
MRTLRLYLAFSALLSQSATAIAQDQIESGQDTVQPHGKVIGFSVEVVEREMAEDKVTENTVPEHVDVNSLLGVDGFEPFQAGSLYVYEIEEVGNVVYASANVNSSVETDEHGRALAVAQCDNSFSTTCTAISIVKYNTRSCAGPTQTSGCSGWAQQTQRGYRWDINSAILFTSQCSSDVLGAYRTLTMKEYDRGMFEADYAISKSGLSGFKLTLTVNCV